VVAPFRTGLEVSEWIDGRMLCKANVALSETYNSAVQRRVRIASRTPACFSSSPRLPVKRAAPRGGCVRLLYIACWAFSVVSLMTAVQEARRSRAWAVGEPGSAA